MILVAFVLCGASTEEVVFAVEAQAEEPCPLQFVQPLDRSIVELNEPIRVLLQPHAAREHGHDQISFNLEISWSRNVSRLVRYPGFPYGVNFNREVNGTFERCPIERSVERSGGCFPCAALVRRALRRALPDRPAAAPLPGAAHHQAPRPGCGLAKSTWDQLWNWWAS